MKASLISISKQIASFIGELAFIFVGLYIVAGAVIVGSGWSVSEFLTATWNGLLQIIS